MNGLQALAHLDPALWLAAGGFALGLLLGALMLATTFCAMGAVSDVVLLADWRRMRAWVLAAAVALAATQALVAAGLVDIGRSIYLAARLQWAGHVLGGVLFGVGMVLAGGCASRNLVRAGSGDLGALLALAVLGLVADAASGGWLEPLRAGVAAVMSVDLPPNGQGVGALAGRLLGIDGRLVSAAAAVALAGTAFAWCLSDAAFRASGRHMASGLGVGLLVTAGWLVTGLAGDELALKPVAATSLTFVRPTSDALHWLAHGAAAPLPGFGVASVLGTVAGAFLWSKVTGRFRLATFGSLGDAARAVAGAALMGFGGVLALGCTLGQGVTGISTLALGAILTFVSLVIGALLGVSLLNRWLDAEA